MGKAKVILFKGDEGVTLRFELRLKTRLESCFAETGIQISVPIGAFERDNS